jgi:sodium transport system permease protein
MSRPPVRRRQLLAIVRKELLEAVRDRRSMAIALLYPLLGPALLALLLGGMDHAAQVAHDEAVPVVGATLAPDLIGALVAAGVAVSPMTQAQADAARAADELPLLVWIDPDWSAQRAAMRPARVRVDAQTSAPATAIRAQRIVGLIAAFGQQQALARLVARGVHPEALAPVQVELRDLASPARHAAALLHIVPLFALLACFIGAMQIALDTTAGERERSSLEPLLLHPVSATTLAMGKWLVTAGAGMVAGAVTLLGMWIALPLLQTDALGLSLRLDAQTCAMLAVIVLPMAPLAASLQLWVAAFARSIKEAQAWLSILLLVPVLPGLLGTAWQLQPAPWMALVPGLSQHVLALQALGDEGADPWLVLLAAAAAFALTAVGIVGTAAALRRDVRVQLDG